MTLQQKPPEWLNKSYIENMLRSALDDSSFVVDDLEISPGSAVGDNYCCQIFRIAVSHGEKNECLSIIGKLKPESTAVIDGFSGFVDLFANEARFFSQDLGNINKAKKLEKQISPTVHHIDFDKKIIFMEDLKTIGYYLQPRGKFLNIDQTILVLESLAILHGSSYYLIEKDPDIKSQLKSPFWSETVNPAVYQFFGVGHKSLDRFVDSYGFSPEWCAKLRGLRKRLSNGWFKVCNLQEGKLNFLLHGDCWMNNAMFHDSNGKVDDVRLLDFQVFNYNSFANDLQYFIFSSVDSELIADKLDWLLEKYYNKLREVAPDVPNLTLDRVKEEFSERHFYGLMFALMFRAFIISDVKPDVGDLTEDSELIVGFDQPRYINELRILLPIFEKAGAF